MATLLDILAALAVLAGTFFTVTGVLGYFRFPDVYTRLHATGKVGVFGVVLLLVAAVLRTPLSWGKGLVLIALLMIAGPVVSHTIGSAAYRSGIPLRQAVRDDLTVRRAAGGTSPAQPSTAASEAWEGE